MTKDAQKRFESIKAAIDKACADLSLDDYVEVLEELEEHVECCKEAAREDLRRRDRA